MLRAKFKKKFDCYAERGRLDKIQNKSHLIVISHSYFTLWTKLEEFKLHVAG